MRYKYARESFTLDEWIDIILGAIDYNAAGYESRQQKLAMITRLLPFVEKRLNLIELAPQRYRQVLFVRIGQPLWLAFFWRYYVQSKNVL
ncbi:MAG: BREX system Lon protease-like protein BrxL [Lachnospiraceae bacterium]